MRLAVVAPWHGRLDRTLPLLTRVLQESSRPPDELWVCVEDADDLRAVDHALFELDGLWETTVVKANVVPTPLKEGSTNKFAVIPYSNKINWALNKLDADAVCYLDNNSVPGPDKYRIMAEALEQNPEFGIVYVTQERAGYRDEVHFADKTVANGAHQLNMTAFCHRVTDDRWTLDMAHALPYDVADALFLDDLSRSLGPCWPVGGAIPHDWHHMDSAAAQL